MLNIGSYLKKHQNKIKDDFDLFENFIFVIKKHTNITLKQEEFSLNKGLIILKTTPVKKNKIFLNKNNILAETANIGIYNIK